MFNITGVASHPPGWPERTVTQLWKAASTFLGAAALVAAIAWGTPADAQPGPSAPASVPSPRIDATHDAAWFFAYKFNVATFPTTGQLTNCAFGGTVNSAASSQHYAFAYAGHPVLTDGGSGLVGTSTSDPVGATFAEIYNSNLNFVVWNDQFYNHPAITGCSTSCSSPWGHSKGAIAWDNQGNGVVLQVTTPSWPGSGSAASPRANDGNTLGCVSNNNLKFGQHFFSLKLSPADTLQVLNALGNASVVTNVNNAQLARIGGPPEIQAAAATLGTRSSSTAIVDVTLSSGVRLLGKPSGLHVPPWQFVSAMLGGVPLRTATWWANPYIPSTLAGAPACWSTALPQPPGAVDIATTGSWQNVSIGFRGGVPNGNHAKFGVSTDGTHNYVIFGDLNQQGALSGNCGSSQNGRGGLFFVIDDPQLHASLLQMLAGQSAATTPAGSGNASAPTRPGGKGTRKRKRSGQ